MKRGRTGEIRLAWFLRNPKVSIGEIIAEAGAHTPRHMAGRHVLAIQDTTSRRDEGARHSIQAHPTIAVDAGPARCSGR